MRDSFSILIPPRLEKPLPRKAAQGPGDSAMEFEELFHVFGPDKQISPEDHGAEASQNGWAGDEITTEETPAQPCLPGALSASPEQWPYATPENLFSGKYENEHALATDVFGGRTTAGEHAIIAGTQERGRRDHSLRIRDGAECLNSHRRQEHHLSAVMSVAFLLEAGPEQDVKYEPELRTSEQAYQADATSLSPLPALGIIGSCGSAKSADLSPARQIIGTIRGRVEEEKLQGLKPAQVKVLRMHLRPDELGEVEIVLRHAGRETKLHISVRKEAVAELLRQDLNILQDQLAPLLSSGSCHELSISIQAEAQLQETANGGTNDMPTHQGKFGAHEEAHGRRPSSGKESSPMGRRVNNPDDETPTHGHSGTGLVV